MDLRTLIRTAVVKTNAIAPFKRLNRIPYDLAVARMRRICRRFPEIKSLYLRHGLTRDDWVPGLSDIDLTLVISSELSTRAEHDFLCAFRKTYRSLKTRYPMLGEVNCLTESFCSGWTRFTMRGYEVRDWRLIYGTDTIEHLYSQSAVDRHRDSLDLALTVYEEFIMDRFYQADEMAWVEKMSFMRIASKIQRYAEALDANTMPPPLDMDSGVSGVLMRLLTLLDEQARQALPRGLSVSDNPNTQPALTKSQIESEYAASKFSGLQNCENFIHSLTVGYGAPYLILQDDLSAPVANQALDSIRRICCASGIRPLILTRSLFEYFLLCYRPTQCLALQSHRHVMFGQDLVQNCAIPTAQSCARAVLNQSLNVMLAPGNCVLYPNDESTSHHLIGKAWRSLFIKLFLDTGAVGSQKDCKARCHELYPELCNNIDQLSDSRRQSGETGRLTHGLLSALARDIDKKTAMLNHEYLSTARFINCEARRGTP